MSDFTSSSEAFRVARERASVATALQDGILHMAVIDAHDEGLSVRETAAALRVPKSTVARHLSPLDRCDTGSPPAWGSSAAWLDAVDAIWAHDPLQYEDYQWVPYEWQDNPDGTRMITRRVRGRSALGGSDLHK